MGMSKSDLNKIFNEFSKGEDSKISRENYGSFRGLGLGLSSVKKISDEMKWQPMLTSEKGKGTTFILKIPIKGAEYES